MFWPLLFSDDNRLIFSGARDKTMKLWNTLGDCKYTETFPEWITCLKVLPGQVNLFVGTGRTVKVMEFSPISQISKTFIGYDVIECMDISADGTLLATGDRAGTICLFNILNSKIKKIWKTKSAVHALAFCPSQMWLCVGSESGIEVLEIENQTVVHCDEFKNIGCHSITWNNDGSILFGGFSDGIIRVWSFAQK